MNRVNKIFGPPGTGKTTRLLKIIEDAMAAGMRPERIAYMSFTKKATDEAVLRAKERFGFTEDRMPWFRTLHSMAFRSLFARRDDVMQEDHFQELGRILGFNFTGLDDSFFMPMGTSLGDKVARIEALSRQRCLSLEDQWAQRADKNVEWLAVEQWARGLKQYKESRGMMDYNDMLEQFDETLDVDLFIIDEAQDLSPLQWAVVRKAAANAKQIYLAGDDDQCIYGWAGADVFRFLRIRAAVEVLPVSYRLPRRIQRLANIVSDNIRVRQPKQWESKAEDGAIHRIGNESGLSLGTGEWLLIARNHRFLSRFQRICESQGYPYMKEGRHSTDDSATRAIFAWEKWRKGQPLEPKELKPLTGVITELEGWSPKESVLLKDCHLLSPEKKRQNWMDVLEIKPARREYLRACLANKEPLLGKPRITISTIHKVKGGEAENVALIPDLSMQPWNQLKSPDSDEEYRVLYVAVTRAKHSLTLIAPKSNRHYKV